MFGGILEGESEGCVSAYVCLFSICMGGEFCVDCVEDGVFGVVDVCVWGDDG